MSDNKAPKKPTFTDNRLPATDLAKKQIANQATADRQRQAAAEYAKANYKNYK